MIMCMQEGKKRKLSFTAVIYLFPVLGHNFGKGWIGFEGRSGSKGQASC